MVAIPVSHTCGKRFNFFQTLRVRNLITTICLFVVTPSCGAEEEREEYIRKKIIDVSTLQTAHYELLVFDIGKLILKRLFRGS